MANAFLENRRNNLEQGYNVGMTLWRQLECDIMSEILYDESIMGDKVLDPALILKINAEMTKRSEYYEPALGIILDHDPDILRSQLDANMKELVVDYNKQMGYEEGDPRALPVLTFEDRYPVEEIRYDKPIRNNDRHPATKKGHGRKKH